MAIWPGKKEPSKDEPAVEIVARAEAVGEADPVRAITGRLSDLSRSLDRATEQVIDYLAKREAKAAGAPAAPANNQVVEKLDLLLRKFDQLAAANAAAAAAMAGGTSTASGAGGGPSEDSLRAVLRPVQERLDAIDARLKAPAQAGPSADATAALAPAVAQLQASVVEQRESLSAAFRHLRQSVDDGLAELAQYLRPKEVEAPPASPGGNADWQRALLGREIAEHPALGAVRQQLLDGVLEGNAAACALVGELLVFQSAAPERMPPLLKEIGEAYYRWQPKTRHGTGKMEEVLVQWLQRTCDEAGIANTIDLVNPGERFDIARHTAAERGVEIAAVFGWIVLRDNGKVYTKAAVAVK